MTRLVTVERLVFPFGEVAPTTMSPVPPLAISEWWWMSRLLTEPSMCDELMSVGTWQIRLGISTGPIRMGWKRCWKLPILK